MKRHSQAFSSADHGRRLAFSSPRNLAQWACFALFCFFADAVHAATSGSASYTITADSLDVAGSHTSSSTYAQDGSMGSVTGVSGVASPVETLKAGYIGQLYEVTALQLAASPTTVNEGATRQLSAVQLLDDTTTLVVPAASITWSVQSGPLSGISSNGLATATTVFQDTPATAHGSFAGSVGTLILSVLNVSTDDLPGYSGDGLDDAWQAQYFGINNPKAAPNVLSDGSGLTNLFKFTAGLAPNNSAAVFQSATTPVSGQPGKKNVSFSPIVAGRTYTVEYNDTLQPVSWTPLTGFTQSDNGSVRTVTDNSAPTGRRFYRIRITNP